LRIFGSFVLLSPERASVPGKFDEKDWFRKSVLLLTKGGGHVSWPVGMLPPFVVSKAKETRRLANKDVPGLIWNFRA